MKTDELSHLPNNEILKYLYYDPKYGLVGKTKFILKVKDLFPKIPKSEIEDFVKKQELQQVNTKKINYKSSYKIVASPRYYQLDIFFLKQYKYSNNNYYIFLIFIDILSKKMFIYPLEKNKKDDIMKAIKTFCKTHEVKGLEGDYEFNFNDLRNFCEDNDIKLSTTISSQNHFSSGNPLGIVDAGVKNIKKRIRNYMISSNTSKFIDNLQELVDGYNETPHSAIKNKTPDYAYSHLEFQEQLRNKLESHNSSFQNKLKFKLLEQVRISKDKNIFDKENIIWSKEVYTIINYVGYKYELENSSGEKLTRLYSYHELLLVKHTPEKRINITNKEKDETRHKTISKLAKEFGISYDEANKIIKKHS
jgi:hypothetical protein